MFFRKKKPFLAKQRNMIKESKPYDEIAGLSASTTLSTKKSVGK
jgi:hypothetical protein